MTHLAYIEENFIFLLLNFEQIKFFSQFPKLFQYTNKLASICDYNKQTKYMHKLDSQRIIFFISLNLILKFLESIEILMILKNIKIKKLIFFTLLGICILLIKRTLHCCLFLS